MLDWLTVLELTAVALVVIGVLAVIAYFVNQARTKVGATESGKTRTVEQPTSFAKPEPHDAAPPPTDTTITSQATVTPPAADYVASSESLLPPLEPIPSVSNAPVPAVEAVPPASKIVSMRFPRFAKPPAVPVARLRSGVGSKPTRSSKIKRRARGGDTASGRRISLAPVKAKPALTRRPKRVMQVRRKKITAPLKRSAKAVHRSPRPVLTPA